MVESGNCRLNFATVRASSPAREARALPSLGSKTKRPADLATCWALYSGDVLLSHGLSPYYHRGCSVSLPCSEWERVGPLRYCHQRSEPDWRFAAPQRRKRESGSLMTMSILHFQKTAGSLISTYRK